MTTSINNKQINKNPLEFGCFKNKLENDIKILCNNPNKINNQLLLWISIMKNKPDLLNISIKNGADINLPLNNFYKWALEGYGIIVNKNN